MIGASTRMGICSSDRSPVAMERPVGLMLGGSLFISIVVTEEEVCKKVLLLRICDCLPCKILCTLVLSSGRTTGCLLASRPTS